MKRDCHSPSGEISIRYLTNGWFLLKFPDAATKDSIFEQRPWFVQGLNFVLLPWRPFSSNPSLTRLLLLTRVKIPFLPNEYWSYESLSNICSSIDTLLKLNSYTLDNDAKAQFARVCVNIDITKPVPRYIKLSYVMLCLNFSSPMRECMNLAPFVVARIILLMLVPLNLYHVWN